MRHLLGEEKYIQSFVRSPEGKRSLGRPRRRWDSGIKVDLLETGWLGVRQDSFVSLEEPVARSC